jgi:AraC family transcriptional regulator of adaptative response / DNA-3-methyladenine glycosylase II
MTVAHLHRHPDPMPPLAARSRLDHDACSRAVISRDPRFDGVFFVGISTTGIYCRPVCPARVSYPERRRFFDSAAAAEQNGYRPCLRCRPELAPGRAVCDAVPRVARAAAMRIAAGALNGRPVAELAQELGVSERHLRRAMDRELGVGPIELAQTHRLLLAKCLLTDTRLPVTRVAYASGFQSLRRFNTVFRQRYRMSPSGLRHRPARTVPTLRLAPPGDWIRLTLGYRSPLAWNELLATIAGDTPPGVGVVDGMRDGRTIGLEGCRGVIFLEASPKDSQVNVDLSDSLLPALMPLLARLRHLLDLDAEPAIIDAQLAEGGLARLVARRPGLRLPGAFDGLEVVARELLGVDLLHRVTEQVAAPFDIAAPSLYRMALTAERLADASVPFLSTLGVPPVRAKALVTVASAVAEGALRLEPGADVPYTLRTLSEISGVGTRLATRIVMRALHWPDALPSNDPVLQRAAGVRGAAALRRRAEQWRPWRSYAAEHLTWARVISRSGGQAVRRSAVSGQAVSGKR